MLIDRLKAENIAKPSQKFVYVFGFFDVGFLVRMRLEHQIRELEYEKKKMAGDFEEQIEVLRTEKRNNDKSNAELKEELEARDQVRDT